MIETILTLTLIMFALGFCWMIVAFIACRRRYMDYQRDSAFFFLKDEVDFTEFVALENYHGKYRNGKFGG